MRCFRLDFEPETIFLLSMATVYVGSLVGLLVLLLRSRSATLELHWIEAVFFELTAIYVVEENLTTLFGANAWLSLYAQRHPSEMSILAREPGIMWLTLIVAYGTFIPNTGRRCAVVTGFLALVPVVAISVAAKTTHVPNRALFLFTSELALWLGLGVALAVYGTTKITRLRQEALDARKLGQYRLTRRLGVGGMGEVFLAEHMLLRRPCAVKIVRPEHTNDPEMVQRFMQEVRLTATLTHPNTVQVFDYGQAADGTVFYVMEYLTGLTIDELVNRYRLLSPERVTAVLLQICGALAEAHDVGLIHRDVKPSNVILCKRGGVHDVAKLLDFGLARIQTTDARAGFTRAKWSAAQRKTVSERMKRYWAARRAGRKK